MNVPINEFFNLSLDISIKVLNRVNMFLIVSMNKIIYSNWGAKTQFNGNINLKLLSLSNKDKKNWRKYNL